MAGRKMLLVAMTLCTVFASLCVGRVQAPLLSYDPAKVGDLPWHLADVWWNLPEEYVLQSLSVDLEVLDDLPPDCRLVISPMGGRISGTTFYFSAQTNIPVVLDKDGRRTDNVGRGFTMMMWDTISSDDVKPGLGGLYNASDHEGKHVSPRATYNWTKGRYTFKLAKLEREVVDGKNYTWVGAFVENHAKKETLFVGATRFKGNRLILNELAAFVEVFGWNLKERPAVPKLRVHFGNVKVNGLPGRPNFLEVRYAANVPPLATVHHGPAYAKTLPPGTLPADEWSMVVDVGNKPLPRTGKPEIIYPPQVPPAKKP